MEFLVIAYAVLAFFIILLILWKWGKTVDDIDRRKKWIEGRTVKRENFDELNGTFYSRFIAPVTNKITDTFTKINEKGSGSSAKKSSGLQTVERQLRLAGMDNLSAEAFTFYKQCFMAVVIIVTLFLAIILDIDAMIKLLIIAVGVILAMLIPNMFLSTKANSRQEKIRLQLPDALDLLGVCIEAGLSFDASLLKVSEKLEGPFIDELLVVYRQIQMGIPRNEALKKLSEVTEIQELKTFISALIQANQLGIPINNVMRVQSEQLRDTRKQQAKEKGAKAPVKMLLPMVGLIFPVLFIILMGPTVLNIIDMFSGTT